MGRKRLLGLWALLALASPLLGDLLPLPTSSAKLPDKSKRTIAYEIEAKLDPSPRVNTVTASGTLTWTNESDVPVPDMYLHLYLNAFKDKHTTFMRESEGSHRGHKFKADQPGGIDITSFQTADGTELKDKQEFVQPDAALTPLADQDQTVVRIPLPAPIAPGEKAVFTLTWESRLPAVFARTGHAGDFHMVAQWYPKPGVWELGGDGTDPERYSWNCHQFHGSSEFYSDYGVYRVRLTVPESYRGRVGATGLRHPLSDEEDGALVGEDGHVTYEHRAEDVHDFAWVCGQDFRIHEFEFEGGSGNDPEEHARVARLLGRSEDEIALTPVQVFVLLQPEHWDQRGRHEQAIRHALTLMGLWFGRYPYPTLTVVDPDHRGRDAGGMEYPTLITGGTGYVRASRQLSPEGVLVHEFAHQHFYGLVGSNEFENAWMDEGLTTYATARTLMKAYPPPRGVTWYAQRPYYGERPIAFSGLVKESAAALPVLHGLFEEDLRMPFGRFDWVNAVAEQLGCNHAPDDASLWPGFGEISPLAFLRELPPLTHLQMRASSIKEGERASSARTEISDPIAGRKAWEYMSRRSYGDNSYRRTSNTLRTLEGLVTDDTMVRIMRTYAEKYRFQHPKPGQFFEVATEVAAADGHGDVSWFFDEFFRKAEGLDFAVEKIQVQDAPKPSKDHEGDWFESIVTVRRIGGLRIPIDIALHVEGEDAPRRYRWNRDDTLTPLGESPPAVVITPPRGEQSRWVKLYVRGAGAVLMAEVDPEHHYGLDRNRTNDGLRRSPAASPSWAIALKALAWTQMTTTFYGGL
jgi:hypothetical protein